MTSTTVRVGLVQMACDPDPSVNLARAEAQIRSAAAQGAQIVVLPELFRSLYFCQQEDPALFDLAEPIPGPSTDRLGPLAGELGIVLVASLFERRAAGLYHNTTVVFDADGSSLGLYRKMHIPDDPSYFEKFYFTPGDLGFRVFCTRFGSIGVLICWDQWYPEAARLTAMAGAQLLVYPTAIGSLATETTADRMAQSSAWQTIQRGHAIANGLFVAAVNRVGQEDAMTFWGESFVCDPLGSVLTQGADQEVILFADLDWDRIEQTRRWWPFLRDRRIDAYGPITARYLDTPHRP